MVSDSEVRDRQRSRQLVAEVLSDISPERPNIVVFGRDDRRSSAEGRIPLSLTRRQSTLPREMSGHSPLEKDLLIY